MSFLSCTGDGEIQEEKSLKTDRIIDFVSQENDILKRT